MDWQSLASANVDLFTFESALNTRANLNVGTYGEVESATVTRSQAFSALTDALAAAGVGASPAAALGQVVAAAGPGGGSLPVSGIATLGLYGDRLLTSVHPITASVSAFDLLSSILQLANGQREVQGDLSVNIPGIVSTHFALVIGQPIVGTGSVGVGSSGITLHSAQTRLTLTLQVGSALGTIVKLPLYLDVASGTATLSAVACSNSSAQATLAVTPGVVDAWIGGVSDSDLQALSAVPSVSSATFLNVGLAQVTGRAHATMSNLNPTSVSFSQTDIAAQTRKTVSTTDFTASLYQSLLSSLSVKVSVLGLGLPPIGLDTTVTQVLGSATTPVDQLLSQTLSMLGVSVGNASTAVTGVQCGRGTLVN